MTVHHSFPFVSIDLDDWMADGCCHDLNIDFSSLHSDIIEELFGLVAVTMVMMIELNENVVCLIDYCCCYCCCCCGCCYTDNLVFGLMFLAVLWCPVTESL